MAFCNHSADATLRKNSKVALGLRESHQWLHSRYSWHRYICYKIIFYCRFNPKEKSKEANLDTQKTPRGKKKQNYS